MCAVSILTPYRADSDHRAAIADWHQRYLTQHFPGVQTVRCDDGNTDGPFCRSAALNRARQLATGDWLWIIDVDTAPHPDDLPAAMAVATNGWCYPYREVLELDEAGTTFVLDGRCPDPHRWNGCTRKSPAYGLPLVHADIWDDVGGWDEQFTGWGYEDLAFRDMLIAAHPPEPPAPIRWVRTLWHPRPASPTAQTHANAEHYNQAYLTNGAP